MTTELRPIVPEVIGDNVFQLVGLDWMLVTAGTKEKCNMMTANWGGMGFLWNKNVCFIFVRPTRYTYDLIENHDHFSLCFLEEDQREILDFCGTTSGRDVDKVEKCELAVAETANKTPYFKESRLVIECRKLYSQDIDPDRFLDNSISELYPENDFHRMYVGEIVNVLERS